MHEWRGGPRGVRHKAIAALERLRNDPDVDVMRTTYHPAIFYFAAIWPADLSWPDSIEHPPQIPQIEGDLVMSDDFSDALSSLVIREVNAARKAGDADRLAGVVADLAEHLGKAIAPAGDGQPELIDKMLMGAEAVTAETAAEMGGLLANIHDIARNGART